MKVTYNGVDLGEATNVELTYSHVSMPAVGASDFGNLSRPDGTVTMSMTRYGRRYFRKLLGTGRGYKISNRRGRNSIILLRGDN